MMRDRELNVNDGPRFRSPFHGWPDGSAPPQQVGNYQLMSPIGSGNFGVVFLAEHIQIGCTRAIKLFQYVGKSSETLRAFVRSARYLLSLDHPNIVKAYEFGTHDNTAYLVMDLIVPGGAIDLLCPRLPLKAALELLLQIASALEYAHGAEFLDEQKQKHRGIYHGDIKPANILVGSGRAYLSDFMLPNMQEFLRRDHGHPCFPYYDTRWYGTPMYMAPEQLRGIVNVQTDLFSFGVCAYEVLAGKYPWNTEREFTGEFFERGGGVEPTPLEAYCSSVPSSLSALIHSCISVHPGDRPRDFREVRVELEQCQTNGKAEHTTAVEGCRYDVALSFAGTDRHVAQRIYLGLRDHCSVFYDQAPDTKVELWGADLSTHLQQVYAEQSRYCVVLISKDYVERAWTNWERRAILQRMIDGRTCQYVLPVRLEDVSVPGLPSTVGMLSLREDGVDGVIAAVLYKLRERNLGT